jgi:hypothetical protein
VPFTFVQLLNLYGIIFKIRVIFEFRTAVRVDDFSKSNEGAKVKKPSPRIKRIKARTN